MVIVIGPTPPGTGVISEAFSLIASKSTSPTRRYPRFFVASSTRLTPNLQRACFWAAVRDDVAEEVQQELVAGDRRQALLTLDTLATDIAPLGW